MKRKIIGMSCMLAGAFLFAQVGMSQVSIGAKGGLNVSNFSGADGSNYRSKALVGFNLGGFATFNIIKNLALQTEVLYSSQGATLESNNVTEDVQLNYFNIPVLLKVMTNRGLYIEAGPQIGFRTGDVSFNSENIEDDINNADFSVAAGIGYQGMSSPFGLGLRYNVGLSKLGNVNENSFNDANYSNGVAQLSLTWRLFGGGKLKR